MTSGQSNVFLVDQNKRNNIGTTIYLLTVKYMLFRTVQENLEASFAYLPSSELLELEDDLSLLLLFLDFLSLLLRLDFSSPKVEMYSTLPTALLSTGLGIGFCVLNFLSILSDFLSQEKLTHKESWPILHKIDKKTKTPIFPNCHLPNSHFLYYCKFYHSRIEVLQNLSAFFVSESLVRENLKGLRENLKHKIPT